jgi:multidrug efflux pump subunit AcrB
LKFSIHHPAVMVAIPVALLIITIGALRGSIIKTTYFPNIESRNTNVVLEMPAGTPDHVTDRLLAEMEEKVWRVNDVYRQEFGGDIDLVQNITRYIGPGTHQGSLYITLVSSEQRVWSSLDVTNRIRGLVGRIPGAEKLEFGTRFRWGKPISIGLASNDLIQLREATETLKDELRQLEELKDVVDDDPPGLKEVGVRLKQKAFALGLTSADVLSQVRSGFFGGQAQRILRGIDEVRIWVRYARSDRSSVEKLADMRIRLPGGKEYPLGEIAELMIERGVMSVNHIDGQRVVKVEADIADPKESVPDIIADIQSDILPGIRSQYPDIHFLLEGQSRENLKTMKAMGRVVPPMLILMFLIVVVTFRSFAQALIVFLLIPFSIIGVLWGHFIQGYIVSVLSWFGAIALAGIVVNDSLVLVSALNRKLKEGKSFEEALLDTGLSRFRPVLLTSLTTIAGLGPLIFMTSHQAQFLSPMAISVGYGLLFGTILTLLMLPSLLVLINRLRALVFRLRKGRMPDSSAALEPALTEEVFAREQSDGVCVEG